MAEINFDASLVPPQQSPDPVPAGWYNLRIVGSEYLPTKNNDGAYIKFEIEVIDGQHAGRKIYEQVNMVNPNPVAAEIGQKRLSAYCHVLGVIQVARTEQLHGIPFKAKVVVKEDKSGQYEPKNELRTLKNINEPIEGAVQPGAPAAGGFAPPAIPQGAVTPPAGSMPWNKPVVPAQPSPAPQQPAAQPAPASSAPTTPTPPQYKEGDVVNGYRLTNNQWVPYTPPAAPPSPPTPPTPPVPPAPPAAPGAPPPWARK